MNIVLEDQGLNNDLTKFWREVEDKSLDLQALVAEVYYEKEGVVSRANTNKKIDAVFSELRGLVVAEKNASGEYESALITTMKNKVIGSFDIISRGSENIDKVCLYVGTRLFTVLKEARQLRATSQPVDLKMSEIVAGAIRESRSIAARAA